MNTRIHRCTDPVFSTSCLKSVGQYVHRRGHNRVKARVMEASVSIQRREINQFFCERYGSNRSGELTPERRKATPVTAEDFTFAILLCLISRIVTCRDG